jgi:subtilisin family serine protease
MKWASGHTRADELLRRLRASRGGLARVLAIAAAAISLTVVTDAVGPAAADDDDDDRPRGRVIIQRLMPFGVPGRPSPRRRARTSQVELVALVPSGQATPPLDAAGFAVVARSTLPAIGDDVVRVRSTRRESAGSALRRLRAVLPGRPVDLNFLYRPLRLDCSASDCPKFAMVGWPMPPSSCGLQTTIGMIDTAVQSGHSSLRPGAVETVTMRASDREPSSDRHGTAIAALLVGQADGAHPGLLPRARLVAVDVFHRGPDGQDATDTFDLMRGLDLLVGRGIRVANLSLSGPDSAVLRQAVEAAVAKGMVMVAAAGNQGPRARPAYPAAYRGVIAVTAVDRNGRLFRRANRGDYISFAAPGVNLMVADTRGRSRPQSGTSLAVPFVAAAVAVAMQGERLAGDLLLDALKASAADLGPPGRDREFGWGLIRLPGKCR